MFEEGLEEGLGFREEKFVRLFEHLHTKLNL